jgi:hypothetical protein
MNIASETSSAGIISSASQVRDDYSLSGQLEAVRLNGVCTMEMVKTLIEMVAKFSCEVQLLKSDNTAMKQQLSDLQQFRVPLPASPSGTVSDTRDVAPKTYRDILTSGGGHPASTTVSSRPKLQPSLPVSSGIASDNQADNGFTTVMRKRKGNNPTAIPSGVPNPLTKPRPLLIGNKSGSSLSTVPKRVRTKALFVSRFSPEVSSAEVEQSLNDQLELVSLKCTRLKTKYNSYSSFHISVSEDDFDLINDANLWPTGCLIAPYYGRLNPDQIYSAENPTASRPPSPTTGVPTPNPDRESVSINTDGAPVEGIGALG